MPLTPRFETKTEDFETKIDGAASFCIENQGTTTLWLVGEDGSQAKIPALSSRTFDGAMNDVYQGTMLGIFGEYDPKSEGDPLNPVKAVLIIKNMYRCVANNLFQ